MAQTLTFKNTLSRQKTELKPAADGIARLYVCGPTVYDHAHLGHARCYVTWDCLYRLLRFVYGADKVIYARNVTDVDDKIINRAKEQGEEAQAIADRYYQSFSEDMATLNCLKPDKEPKATEHIHDMLAMVRELLANDLAYIAADGTVYYDVQKKADYGKLSGRKLEDQQAGARVEVDANKRHPADFALWKPENDPDGLAWSDLEGVIPRGRPGWHIECSAMIRSVFDGKPIDIHAGGQDLIFPHHENEIAQSEGCCGDGNFVKLWLHNGFVNVSGDKMSKSTGNFKSIRDLLERYSPNAIRYFILSQKYDKPIDFTEESLDAAEAWAKRFKRTVYEGKKLIGKESDDLELLSPNELNLTIADDLNTPSFLAQLNTLMKKVNQSLVTNSKDSLYFTLRELETVFCLLGFQSPKPGLLSGKGEAKASGYAKLTVDFKYTDQQVKCFKYLAGLLNIEQGKADEPFNWIGKLIEERTSSKKSRDFTTADKIRDELAKVGILLKDTREGTTYELVDND